MNIRIQVRHDAAPEAIQKYITSEFEHVVKKFTPDDQSSGEASPVISAEFILDQEGSNGHIKTFEALIHVPNDTLKVKEHDTEAHKAIDATMKVIEKLLRKHKETYARPGTLIRHNEQRRTPSA